MTDAPTSTRSCCAEVENGVLWLTINRPDAGNAITPDGPQPDDRALRRRERRPSTCAPSCSPPPARSTSAPAPTCGPDASRRRRSPRARPSASSGDAARMIRTGIQRLIGAILDCEKPVIAALNGTAAGGGAHDGARVRPRRSRPTTPASSRCSCAGASSPTAAAPTCCPRLVGLQKAKELVFFGDDLARRRGRAHRAREQGRARAPSCEATATEWAERLAAGPDQDDRRSPSGCSTARSTSTAPPLFEEEALLRRSSSPHTEDSKEGVASFVERRPTRVQGLVSRADARAARCSDQTSRSSGSARPRSPRGCRTPSCRSRARRSRSRSTTPASRRPRSTASRRSRWSRPGGRHRPQRRARRHHVLLPGRVRRRRRAAASSGTRRWRWPPASARSRWRGGRASAAAKASRPWAQVRAAARAATGSGAGRAACCGRSTRSPC